MSGLTQPSQVTYELVAEISRVAAETGSTSDRVRRLAALFAEPQEALASRPNSERLVRELDQLTRPLQYLVLNVPLTLARNNERIFVAVLRRDIAVPVVPPGDDTRTPAGSDVREVSFFGGADSTSGARPVRDIDGLLASRWKQEWARYARHTYDLQERGVYTWNQYLLHGCQFPQALGLAWNGESSGRYIVLTPDLAGLLYLPLAREPAHEWVGRLVHLPEAPHCERLPDTHIITQLWRTMEPHIDVKIEETVGHAIHHLLRSYAIWGGDGFISIPVLLGTATDARAIAVLSLCSSPNLCDRDILTWYAIASACFASVTAHELVEQRVVEDLRAALDVYATVAHETNSLISKHFCNVPQMIISGIADNKSQHFVLHAWESMAHVALIGYFFAKARVGTAEEAAALRKRFVEPLRALYVAGRLGETIRLVAARVYKFEAHLYGSARIPSLDAVAVDEGSAMPFDNAQFAHCYILCAEPIRNLAQYGDGSAAEWELSETTANGVRVALTHRVKPGARSLPRSATFEALGGFLSFYGERTRAVVEWAAARRSVRWLVEIEEAVLLGPGKERP